MLVYGDTEWHEPISDLLHWLEVGLREPSPDIDPLRALLVRAGQTEQAVCDAAEHDDADPRLRPLARLSIAITDRLAWTFLAAMRLQHAENTIAASCESTRTFVLRAQALAESLKDVIVRVKAPEVFTFYATFPEAYVLAADAWAEAYRTSSAPVTVIGVRSIGTTLSALVCQALGSREFSAERYTVRPTGHPFERRAALPRPPDPARHYLIVDEGPGFSGSSIASVAQALADAGVPRSHIAFMPGHAGLPGGMGKDWVSAWWQNTARFPANHDDVRVENLWIGGMLAAHAAATFGADDQAKPDSTYYGAGHWRHDLYKDPADYPAVAEAFDKPKTRVTLSNGRRVLWKFAGFSAAPHQAGTWAEKRRRQMVERAHIAGISDEIAVVHGFIGRRWVEGRPLSRADATESVIAHIGRYIAQAAHIENPPLSPDEACDSVARLRDMLHYNAGQLLGEPKIDLVDDLWFDEAALPRLAYPDGRLAPHEWIRTREGRLVKPDPGTRDADHTLIGRQCVLWDVAGAWVEWGLEDAQGETLVNAFAKHSGIAVDAVALRFYRAAYAAFRAGTCAMFAPGAHDDERARLERTGADYTAQLSHLLVSDSFAFATAAG